MNKGINDGGDIPSELLEVCHLPLSLFEQIYLFIQDIICNEMVLWGQAQCFLRSKPFEPEMFLKKHWL